jgi:hypothetical protein
MEYGTEMLNNLFRRKEEKTMSGKKLIGTLLVAMAALLLLSQPGLLCPKNDNRDTTVISVEPGANKITLKFLDGKYKGEVHTLRVHPSALLLKDGKKVTLGEFKPGDILFALFGDVEGEAWILSDHKSFLSHVRTSGVKGTVTDKSGKGPEGKYPLPLVGFVIWADREVKATPKLFFIGRGEEGMTAEQAEKSLKPGLNVVIIAIGKDAAVVMDEDHLAGIESR